MILEEYRFTGCVKIMSQLRAISIKKIDGMDNKSWSLDIKILSKVRKVQTIANAAEAALDGHNVEHMTDFNVVEKHLGIMWSSILLIMRISCDSCLVFRVMLKCIGSTRWSILSRRCCWRFQLHKIEFQL